MNLQSSTTVTPTLSLVLTTFNRHNYLKLRLKEWALLFGNHVAVEAIVLDASTEKYSGSLPAFVKYFWRPGKRGLFQDYLEAFEQSSGRFIWFVTDDDSIHFISLKGIFHELTYADLLVVPQRLFSAKGRYLGVSDAGLSSQIEFSPMSEMPRSCIQHLTHIGSFIFSREMWSRTGSQAATGKYFPHFFPLFVKQNASRRSRLTRNASLNVYVGRASWLTDTAYVWITDWHLVQRYLASNGYHSCNAHSLRKLLMLCALTSTGTVKATLREAEVRTSLITRAILVLPQWLINLFYSGYLSVTNNSLARYTFDMTRTAIASNRSKPPR